MENNSRRRLASFFFAFAAFASITGAVPYFMALLGFLGTLAGWLLLTARETDTSPQQLSGLMAAISGGGLLGALILALGQRAFNHRAHPHTYTSVHVISRYNSTSRVPVEWRQVRTIKPRHETTQITFPLAYGPGGKSSEFIENVSSPDGEIERIDPYPYFDVGQRYLLTFDEPIPAGQERKFTIDIEMSRDSPPAGSHLVYRVYSPTRNLRLTVTFAHDDDPVNLRRKCTFGDGINFWDRPQKVHTSGVAELRIKRCAPRVGYGIDWRWAGEIDLRAEPTATTETTSATDVARAADGTQDGSQPHPSAPPL